MNFNRSGWFQKYLEFRAVTPHSPRLPSYGVKVLEDASFHNDLEQAVYYFLQPTGLLYGGLIAFPFPDLEYPKSRYFDSVDRVFMIFLEALFACLVADRHFLLDDLVEEEDRFLPAVEVALGFFLEKNPAALMEEEARKTSPGLWGFREGLYRRFERELGRRITHGATIFAHPDLFNNSFLFLDLYACLLWQRQVALEENTLAEAGATTRKNEQRQRETLLRLMTVAGWAGGTLEKPERRLILHFLRSAGLPKSNTAKIRRHLTQELRLEDVEIGDEPWIVRRFYLELVLLTVLVDRVITPEEMELVEKLAERLGLWENEIQQSQSALELFLISNEQRFGFLGKRRNLLNIKARLQERAVLAVKKNLDHIVNEIRETHELYSLLMKSAKTTLTPEERLKVRQQMLDILKTIPALAVFALPGGGILLPVLIRILPFNLLPSSFED